MAGLSYSISDEIFEKFPAYTRGVVLAFDSHNMVSPQALVVMLREAEAAVRQQVDLETISEHPRIKCWREAYRAL